MDADGYCSELIPKLHDLVLIVPDNYRTAVRAYRRGVQRRRVYNSIVINLAWEEVPNHSNSGADQNLHAYLQDAIFEYHFLSWRGVIGDLHQLKSLVHVIADRPIPEIVLIFYGKI